MSAPKGGGRLSNRVRELRFHAGEMTQGQLAERAGVTRQTIAAIERNKYAPSLETAFRLADAFGLPLTEVFAWEPDD